MYQLLKTYHKRLTNLTSANRSLLLLRPFKSHFFDIHSLDFVNGKPSFQVIEDLIQNNGNKALLPEIDPRFGKSNDLSKHLKQIWRLDQTIREERGAEELYVGYPFVYGKMLDGTPVRCPLAFFPIDLSISKNQWRLNLKESGICLNRTFLLAYSHFNNVEIDHEQLENLLDEKWENSKIFLTALYEILKKSELEINFNSDLFNQKLETFETILRADLEPLENGELKLFSNALLGFFPQTGSYISTDYDILLNDDILAQFVSLEEFFGERQQLASQLKEEHFRLPLPVDASQEEAISQVKKGHSIVIQGPPGTGKSQLICNLMADFAAQGKKVLLVCQKRAAIDTVYQRLGEVGLHPFAALIHDFKQDRKALYEKIAGQIDRILPYKHENQSLNAIFLEREFDAVCRKTDQLVREFSELKEHLYDKKHFGITIKELYLLARHQTDKELDLSGIYSFFNFNTLDDFLSRLSQLEKYRDQLSRPGSEAGFWQKRKSFATYTLGHLQKLKSALDLLVSVKERLTKIEIPFHLEIGNELNLLSAYRPIVGMGGNFGYFKEALIIPEHKEKLENLKISFSSESEDIFKESLMEMAEKEEKSEKIETAIAETSDFIKRTFWNLFSKKKKEVFSILRELELPATLHSLAEAKRRLEVMRNIIETSSEIGEPEAAVSLNQLNHEIQKQLDVAELAHRIQELTPNTLLTPETDKSEFDHKIDEWMACLSIISEQKSIWLSLFSEEQIEEINVSNASTITGYLDEEFDNISARDALYESLTAVEKKAYHLTSEKFYNDYAIHFKQNLILHCIDDLEEKYPDLRHVSSLQLAMKEEELQRAVVKKQQISKEYLLMKLRENTYRNIEKNRLGNPTTYRDLKHQTTKKRLIWPVRKLIESLSEEIFDLIPCWMASPETVSAIFPIGHKPLFDLVIFDEASQCFAEKGLPAMLRGKTVVIAGDSKQLQPNDLYRIRISDNTEGDNLLEVESLLEMASQILPQHTLKGHYRSKSLDLIDFSNQHFYKNKLTLLPDFEDLNKGKPAIDYIKVEGQWKANKNQREAEKVLELVRLLRTAGSRKSIGVVTFNFFQAELIRDILEEDYPEVTVKNIENIQGDEYDIIIFSVGYAAGKNGKVRSGFGSLSLKGGENRLNVAITRAREQIYVVSSIWPEQLSTDKSVNEGPDLLKKYLLYARNVSEGFYKPTLRTDLKNGWAVYLKTEISGRHNNFKTELPFADLTEKTDKNYQSLMLTDDELLYTADSLKESFAYVPLTLKNKGWKYKRAWSRNWWLSPEKLIPPSEEKQEKV